MTKFERNKYAGLFLIFILVLLIIISVGMFVSLHTDPVDNALEAQSVINTLFVVEEDSQVLVTEILMYYPVLKRGAMFEIPGNIGAIYEILDRTDRIDAVYTESGIEAYKAEIEKLTKVDIPFTVEISMDSFCQLTDLLGGFKVYVPFAVDVTEEDGRRRLLPNGAVSLDGDKIRDFMYYKLPDEDEDALSQRRQEAFIAFLSAFNRNGSQMLEKNNFRKLSYLFRSNLEKSSLNRLLQNISNVDGESLTPNTVRGVPGTTSDGKKVLFPYYGGTLVKETISMMMTNLVSSDEISFSRTYVLNIFNGTGVQGLARNTSVLLRGVGYEINRTDNSEQSYEKTVIINHIGSENNDVAKSLGDFIHCDNIIQDEAQSEDADYDSGSVVDFTIILGSDFDGRYVR